MKQSRKELLKVTIVRADVIGKEEKNLIIKGKDLTMIGVGTGVMMVDTVRTDCLNHFPFAACIIGVARIAITNRHKAELVQEAMIRVVISLKFISRALTKLQEVLRFISVSQWVT